MPGTYGKTWWREGYACGCMIQSIEDIVEPRLRAAGHLGSGSTVNIFQQAYNTSVSASAGTHSGGGALDHDRASEAETRIWRECGWADWRRGSPYDSMDQHNHGIVIGCPHLSGDAADQVYDYKCGRNGLADNGSDPGPDVPYITWQDAYDKYIGQEGLLGMSDMDKWERNTDQKVAKDDEWHMLKIDDEDNLSLATGPTTFVAYVGVQVTGLPLGAAAQFRCARVLDYPGEKKTTIESWYPIQEVIGTSGDAFGTFSFINEIGGKQNGDGTQKVRLYAKSPEADVTVVNITSRTLHD